jgi:hypothetical protein
LGDLLKSLLSRHMVYLLVSVHRRGGRPRTGTIRSIQAEFNTVKLTPRSAILR